MVSVMAASSVVDPVVEARSRPGSTAPEAGEEATDGLRERKKRETRAALTDAALGLFAERGFDQTTVEDIAAVVGVSPRTFHRYFARKEDAVFADAEARLARFKSRLTEQEAPTVLAAVGRAARAAAQEYAESPDRERTRSRLVSATPSLRAYNLSRYDEWSHVIAAFAADAVGEDPSDRWPATVGACTMAALTAATRRWAAGPDSDLVAEYDAVLELLAGLDRPLVHPAGRRGATS